MKLCYSRDENNNLCNLHVVDDEENIISSVLEKIPSKGMASVAVSTEMPFDIDFFVVSSFVFLSNSSKRIKGNGTTLLCCFEKDEVHEYSLTYGKIGWSEITLSIQSSSQKDFLICGDAVYLSLDPIDPYSASTEFPKGRWLFPHPKGTRVAMEHLKATTLQDDYLRLQPYINNNPRILDTFTHL